jgi:hypothetical protein
MPQEGISILRALTYVNGNPLHAHVRRNNQADGQVSRGQRLRRFSFVFCRQARKRSYARWES